MAKSRKYKKSKKSRKMRTRRRNRSTKLWNQKGCSHNRYNPCKLCKKRGGGCGCGCGGKSLEVMEQNNMKGGSCAQCNLMKGGSCPQCNLIKGGGGVPAPLVGSPWTPNIGSWPGVQGIPGQTNYLAMNQYPVDLQTNGMMSSATQNDITNSSLVGISNNTASSLKGGRGRRIRIRRGGGLIPQDLVNLGRSFTYGVGSAYNSLSGLPQGPSPLPYKDQLPNTMNASQLRY